MSDGAKVYSVWKAKTGERVIEAAPAEECAKAMGIKLSTFYGTVSRVREGKSAKWQIDWWYKPTELRNSFASDLCRLRIAHGWSRRQLSKISGISNIHCWKLEHGDVCPSAATLESLADALGVTMDRLWKGDKR